MQDPVKLLITFPQSTNIEQMAQRLRSDYTFPKQVKIIGPTKLSCSFETMADLLEIDFINTFGAIATKVINSRTFSQQMNINNQLRSSEAEFDSNDYQSSLGEFPNGSLLSGELHMKAVQPRKRQRLTSLEDEVIEEEKLRQMLAVYNSNDDIAMWQAQFRINEKCQNLQGSTMTHQSLQSIKGIPIKKEESIWAPLLGGLALASVLLGGFKLIRMVIG